jgi:hypothetical protein
MGVGEQIRPIERSAHGNVWLVLQQDFVIM